MLDHKSPVGQDSDSKKADGQSTGPELTKSPAISLPKGGGAIRGIGEKFAANPVTGSGSMSVPIATSPGRSGFGPQLSLSYDSGAGNGPFGFGWSLSLPSITRKTDKGLPQYFDAQESDVFILSGAEDLVPELEKDTAGKLVQYKKPRTVNGITYIICRYRPRIEGLFARIERWSNATDPRDVHWRTLSKDNILTIYGLDDNSRIVDPQDPSSTNLTRIFSWLICETRDDKGNGVLYRYKAEDGLGADLGQVNERNRGSRTDKSRATNRYLKHIYYGNQKTLLDKAGQRPQFLDKKLISDSIDNADWMFEVVFDYGEHDKDAPKPNDTGEWGYRPDPFSSYRSGFEVRTTRLCQRVLMFHHFGDEEIGKDCLVQSTDFTYSNEKNPDDTRNPIYSFLLSVTQSGYKRNSGGYLKRGLPPLAFEYTQPIVQDTVESVDPASLENLPIGVDGTIYQWIDLHGEGIPGILTEQAGAWHYKRNVSPIGKKAVEFAPLERVATKPNLAMAGGAAQFMDLAGDGQPDLVVMDGPMPGLYEHDTEEGWQPFQPFISRLSRDTHNPNLKFVDLDGDGHADVLITEEEAFIWHASLAEEGFGPARRVNQVLDEEKGPRLVFADGTQSIYLADLSGDGLTDLVRIRNGEVCYWPNLGYARFGAKVTMDQSPWFDAPDMFDQRRIRLADIDGSGLVDILYLTGQGVQIYFNQSGNSWSQSQTLKVFPRIDDMVSIVTTDLLGNGTACLVWASPLPGDARQQMRYVNLMGGQKPHLLVKTINNLGAETLVQYAPSTKFYLQDKRDGKPWITKLPFPVHVVEKVTVSDKWRKTSFSSTYSYHHGYFDGFEREFRGFGRVEQIDIEDYGIFEKGNKDSPYITSDLTLYQPPVKTTTWYHTGAFLDRDRILSQFEHEYFPHWLEEQHPGLNIAFQENALPQPDLAAEDLTAEEWREALRACKGMMLRQEVVELDIDALVQPDNPEQQPVKLFSTAYHNCHIRCLQSREINRHAVFLVAESEAITYHYELDIRASTIAKLSPDAELNPDPRIAHTLNLRFDDYGRPLQSVAVVYPRKIPYVDTSKTLESDQLTLIQNVQNERHVAYTENHFTNELPEDPDQHRLPSPCEVLTYELTGFLPKNGDYFTLVDLRAFKLSDIEADAYHEQPRDDNARKRMIEWMRLLYFKDDLSGPEPFRTHAWQGLPYETYKLALTEPLLDAIFKDSSGTNKLDEPIDGTKTARDKLRDAKISGYLNGTTLATWFQDLNTTGQYWMRSGIAGFAPDAAQHFYLPERYTDPFDNVTTLEYDGKYDLFVKSSTDSLQNKTEVTDFDYRVLAPREMKDINENLSAVYFDILGLPAAMAVKGKGDNREGDNLTGFTDALANPELADRAKFFGQADLDEVQARNWLGNATARHVYYFGEIEVKLPDGKTVTRWGEHPACASGIVREQHVNQLAPGVQSPLQAAFEYSDGMGSVVVKKVQAEPEKPGQPLRWIANGKTILNNKGKPVKQYEPYFSAPAIGHRFDDEEAGHEEGVTPVIYYDAAGRTVRTEMPDGSFSRVEFSPWHVRLFDQNDTVKEPANAWFARKSAGTPEEKRAAQLAAEHADTPSLTILDSLGREVIAIAHNRVKDTTGVIKDEKYLTFTKLDAEGKPLWIRDARKNLVMQYISPPKANNDPSDTMAITSAPCYDIAGNLLFQHSMDAGDRWMINDAAGKPMVAWDFNDRQDEMGAVFAEHRVFFTQYDALHRPMANWLVINNGAAQMIERFEYIDTINGIADAHTRNLRGQLHRHFDSSGLKQIERIDFKGNPLELRRQLAKEYKASVIDWQTGSATALLETEAFVQITEYDALNRMARLFNWHHATPNSRVAVYEPQYSPRGVLASETLILHAAKTATGYTKGPQAQTTVAIQGIEYDAKGQKQRIQYGNGTITRYQYDPETFRLQQLRTTRPGSEQPLPHAPSNLKDDKVLQNLYYTYDPVGNITEIHDDAYEPVFFKNQIAEPVSRYSYDALYRLVEASGRESATASGPPSQTMAPKQVDFPVIIPGALRKYTQSYTYDAVGNFKRVHHVAGSNGGSWTRDYAYAFEDTTQPASNRLWQTWTGGDRINAVTYRYDSHGNMLNAANIAPAQSIRWDYRDMIHFLDLEGGGLAFYNYGADKQRTRKRLERLGGTVEERIDLGGLEICRRFNNGTLVEEIESVHVFEGQQRVLLIDDVLQTDNAQLKTGALYRYQYSNHLGSAALELDDQAQIISYEEFHPYGTTAYEATRKQTEVPKRYRYTGMERDEESGFGYHGARYYLPWLGRWGSVDPIARGRATKANNAYAYVQGKVMISIDPHGLDDEPASFGQGIVKGAGEVGEGALLGSGELALRATGFVGAPKSDSDRYYEALSKGEVATAAKIWAQMQLKDSATAHFVKGAWGLLKSTGESAGDLVTHVENKESGKTGRDLVKVVVGGALIYLSLRGMKARLKQVGETPPPPPSQPAAALAEAATNTKGSDPISPSEPVTPQQTSRPSGTKNSSVLSNVSISIEDGFFVVRSSQGKINARFDAKIGKLNINDIEVLEKQQGAGTELYKRAIQEASKSGEVKSVVGFMSKDNLRAIKMAGGDINASPRAKILNKLGYTQHAYDPKTKRVTSTKPNP
ncbi:MAG: SpvB/TcaC N-terminal domain-containing protein [Candidatus Nitrotoga sp.]|nr:SpvB/TcaC N-terminal domain-containing protein [Candidatus Nitrotoga sp.]